MPPLVATAGNVLGACTTCWLGRETSRIFGRRREPAGKGARAARLLRRHGAPALLLSPVPVIGDVLVALAGATPVPFRDLLVLGGARQGRALRGGNL